MAKRRRSNKKEPKGVIYLIVLACLAAVFHEPIANALRNKLPVPTEKTANGQKQRKPPEIPYCRLH